MVDVVPNSILDGIKQSLGIDPSYTVFDPAIIMHINSVFGTLHQLGVGPIDGYEIEDNSSIWSEYIGDNKNLNGVKTYVFQKVKILFDPPSTSFALDAINKSTLEFEWRLNVEAEGATTSVGS